MPRLTFPQVFLWLKENVVSYLNSQSVQTSDLQLLAHEDCELGPRRSDRSWLELLVEPDGTLVVHELFQQMQLFRDLLARAGGFVSCTMQVPKAVFGARTVFMTSPPTSRTPLFCAGVPVGLRARYPL